MDLGLQHYLVVSALLFTIGLFAVITRRNAIAVLMGIELVLNSANLNLVAFSKYVTGDVNGHLFALFVIALAAAEAAVALAIVLAIYRCFRDVDMDLLAELKE